MKTILLAEDSQDDELLFLRVLRQAGVENPVFIVRDGDEALAYLKGEGNFADREKFPVPAVLFLDLRMRRLDGWEVLKWLKVQPGPARMLIVVLTVFGEERDISQAYALGAHSFLIKPVTAQDLENLISHFKSHWIRPAGWEIPRPPNSGETTHSGGMPG